ncbi:hypothetical protein [Salinispora cortesiana]|uniref:hypothetical protein n=1 Tax=Salinispora cortesiana TaxID=1305843 RepID=UPI0012BC36E0|nr:hypothetical protein [Salinispora cortesiana]
MADNNNPFEFVQKVYPEVDIATCPFTDDELAELDGTNELLVYLPAHISAADLCRIVGVRANIDFDNETLVKNAMVKENQWFITSASHSPELLYFSAQRAVRIYEDEGLHGMDLRRYLAFTAIHSARFGVLPDQCYWTFLLSGKYDRSGVSVVGFDAEGVLNHHGWMKNFKAKFTGSRYIVLAPRIEVTPQTELLERARRGLDRRAGRESDLDS